MLVLLTALLYSRKPDDRGTLRFIAASILLISLNTVRWEYGSEILRQVQSVLALGLPVVAWHSFVQRAGKQPRYPLLLLSSPALLALCIREIWPPATDFTLCLLFLGYGTALIRKALPNGQSLISGLLAATPQHSQRTFFAGSFLCVSGLTDLLIALDFSFSSGTHVTSIIFITHVLLIAVIGALIFSLINPPSRPQPITRHTSSASDAAAAEMTALYAIIEKKISETELYLNPDLTLAVMARKTGIPARHFSAAVNAVRQCNVSQWINGFRIERAKKLLLETSLPVTDIMLESGFNTKSNFNREFQRLSGTSPALFRQQGRMSSALHSGKE